MTATETKPVTRSLKILGGEMRGKESHFAGFAVPIEAGNSFSYRWGGGFVPDSVSSPGLESEAEANRVGCPCATSLFTKLN